MLEIPEEIKNLFRADNTKQPTQKKFKLIFYNDKIESLYPYETLFPDETLFPSEHGEPWLVIEDGRIESETLMITESLSESEDLDFGSCEASMMEIVVADVIEDLTGREFTLTVEIGGYEMALGIYTVESFVRQADRRKRKITAYDRMRWFSTDVSGWYNDLAFPMTLRAFRDSLCEYIGIQQFGEGLIFDSLEISKTIEPQELSGLDVLKAICQINGCFGHVDKTGMLTYICLQETGLYPSEELFPYEELYPTEFGGDGQEVELVSTYHQGMTYEDYLVDGINGVAIREQEGHVGANAGEGDNVYTVEGNFLVYGKSAAELLEISEALLEQISGRIYRPASLTCNAMPWVEVGDALRIPTRDDIVETFVMRREIKGCQFMTDTIRSTGSKKREEVFGINKQIIQLEGKTAVVIKNVEEVSVKVTDLKEYTESEFKVTNDKINLKVSKGEVSSQLSLEPDKVILDSNRLIVNSTNFKLDGNGNATFSGTVKSAAIESSTITGGSININNIFKVDTQGNTSVTGNHFTWSATNSSMTSDGTITCKNIRATNGTFRGNITGSTITGSSIDVGPLIADDDGVYMGAFYVNPDSSYELKTTNNSFRISAAQGPGGSMAELFIGSPNGAGTTIQGSNIITGGRVECWELEATDKIEAKDLLLTGDSWWAGWTLTRTMKDVYRRIERLENAE